jgi:hypothetical protein
MVMPAHVQTSKSKETLKLTIKNVKIKIKTDDLNKIKLSIKVNEERILIGEVVAPDAANSEPDLA